MGEDDAWLGLRHEPSPLDVLVPDATGSALIPQRRLSASRITTASLERAIPYRRRSAGPAQPSLGPVALDARAGRTYTPDVRTR